MKYNVNQSFEGNFNIKANVDVEATSKEEALQLAKDQFQLYSFSHPCCEINLNFMGSTEAKIEELK